MCFSALFISTHSLVKRYFHNVANMESCVIHVLSTTIMGTVLTPEAGES